MAIEGRRGKVKLGGELINANFDLASGQISSQFQYPDERGLQLIWDYYHDQDKRQMDCGWFRLDINAVMGGYVGANCMLSADLQLTTQEGFFGLSGIGSDIEGNMPEDYNPDRRAQLTSSQSYSSLSCNASGVHGKVGLFVGGQIGMQVSADLLWQDPDVKRVVANIKDSPRNKKPLSRTHGSERSVGLKCSPSEENKLITKLIDASMPVDTNGWLKLCGAEAAAAFTLGVGIDGNFMVSYKDGRFVFICSAQVTKGVGGRVKMGFYMDAGNVDLMVYTILKSLAQMDYRKVSFFDKTQDIDVFDHLADALLVAIITGARLKLLFQPKKENILQEWLASFFDNRQELAPQVACYILNLNPVSYEPLGDCERDYREAWFDNLMPEVRGRLIYLLICEQHGRRKEKIDIYRDEALQREAILKILEWHSSVGGAKYRQYKETLVRINNKGEKEDRNKNGYKLLGGFFNKNWDVDQVGIPIGFLSHKKQAREFKLSHQKLTFRAPQ